VQRKEFYGEGGLRWLQQASSINSKSWAYWACVHGVADAHLHKDWFVVALVPQCPLTGCMGLPGRGLSDWCWLRGRTWVEGSCTMALSTETKGVFFRGD